MASKAAVAAALVIGVLFIIAFEMAKVSNAPPPHPVGHPVSDPALIQQLAALGENNHLQAERLRVAEEQLRLLIDLAKDHNRAGEQKAPKVSEKPVAPAALVANADDQLKSFVPHCAKLGLPRNYTMSEQQFDCPEKRKIGKSEGGWMTCITPSLSNNPVVYSVGLGNDPSFDLAFLEEFGGTVHAFDPTPTGENLWNRWKKPKPDGWKFHLWGLNGVDGPMTFLAPKGHDQYSIKNFDGKYKEEVKIEREGYTLSRMMEMLGDKHVDICKIDIEGSEWGLIDNLVATDPPCDQIFFEFHFFDRDFSDNYSSMVTMFIEKLNSLGYLWFHRNDFRILGIRYTPPGVYNYIEYSFIRQNARSS
eukprot:TRINITY_DN12878_c0_g1_i1.p1 TRINITY_DN12878_c0_g1~~TRINITY_DN12878_c0_g1_i1.p1  ORF type:complete len:362 (-),score=76.80 TRINITY_DN12878_c0_g1_i1:67-1152(-)